MSYNCFAKPLVVFGPGDEPVPTSRRQNFLQFDGPNPLLDRQELYN